MIEQAALRRARGAAPHGCQARGQAAKGSPYLGTACTFAGMSPGIKETTSMPPVVFPGGEEKRSCLPGIRLFGWQVCDGTTVPHYSKGARLQVPFLDSSHECAKLLNTDDRAYRTNHHAIISASPEPVKSIGGILTNPGADDTIPSGTAQAAERRSN